MFTIINCGRGWEEKKEFAKKEFKSYILVDFVHTSKVIMDLFDDMYDMDFFL